MSAALAGRLSSRQQSFMQGPDWQDAKRRREEAEIRLRKEKRTEAAQKRRNIDPAPSTSEPLTNLEDILSSIGRNAEDSTMLAALSLRKILAAKIDPPIQAIVDGGFVPILVAWLHRHDLPSLQYEACWALTNIASGSHSHAQTLVCRGVFPILYELFGSPSEEVRDQAFWLLGNLAGDSPEIRDAILQSDGLQRALRAIEETLSQERAKNICWAVSNLCRGKPPPKFEFTSIAIPFLCRMLETIQDQGALADPLWALSHMCATRNERIQMLLTTGIAKRLAEIAAVDSYSTQYPALRCLGNIAAGNSSQTQVLVDLQLAGMYRDLLRASKSAIRKEAAWTLSNWAAGTKYQVQALLNADVFPVVIEVLLKEPEDVQTELLWAVYNAVMSGCEDVVHHLVHNGVVPTVGALLKAQSPQLLYHALDVLRVLLEAGKQFLTQGGDSKVVAAVECSCLDSLEALQTHANEQIYQRAHMILVDYFELSDPGDPLTAVVADMMRFEV